MIRYLLIGAAVTGALLTTGCASVVNGQNQSVSVTTKSKGDEVAGAKCSLTNDKGVWYLTTPGSVAVHRSYGDLTVSCAVAGHPNGTAAAKSATTGAVFGNILVGGVIGAGIDVATGAAYNYPNQIPVEMGKTTRIEEYPTAGATKTATRSVGPANSTVVATVPYLNEAQQAHFKTYLSRPAPKAFAIAVNGHYIYATSTTPLDKSLPTDPSERALLVCGRLAGIACELFAVDDTVVFQAQAPQAQQPAVRHSAPGRYPVDPALAAVKVPFLNDGQQVEYQRFLSHPLPRAFAISDNGHYAMAWSSTALDKTLPADPSARALAGCKRLSGQACQLYLVDNEIVYPVPAVVGSR